ncbi:MAG: S49 family peptidase [Isosphaeraceae bacterium]
MTTARSALVQVGPSAWRILAVTAMSVMLCGCHCLNFHTTVQADAKVAGDFNGKFKVESTQFPDLGPMVPRVVRCAGGGQAAGRIAIVDIDGLIVNQNLTGISSAGENPVAAFREKLILAACDPSVRAVVLRVNSPGGGVAASELMAEELRRFRQGTGKPVVACLLDLATGGAYYIAVGADLIVAQPSSITGSIGAVANFYNLELAMSAANVTVDTVKSGDMVDMGSVLRTVANPERAVFEEIVKGHAKQFQARVASMRPAMTPADNGAIEDGRIVAASRAVELHLVDRLGFLDDAIEEAERRSGLHGAEVVLLQRADLPIRSIYAIAPNTPIQNGFIPASVPGIDRSKLPTFLYLWQPDPTITRVAPP